MQAAPPPLLALLTDFGTRDWYVAMLKAVILSRCPTTRLVDITHEIPPQDITAGAFTLAAAAPWFPAGTVFLAVVDPGVGSDRAVLAARADGRYFVGPDNGLLGLCLQRAKRLTVIRLTKRRYWLRQVSQTFQGRDVMAPVAAHLASGGSLNALGGLMRRATPLELPPLQRKGTRLIGHIAHIDTYGNLITTLPGTLASVAKSAAPTVLQYKRQASRMVSSYAQGRPNELIAVVGSLGFIELAVRNGSAAWMLSARRGDEVWLTRERP